ncbi:MAG: hypothetical protein ACJ76N_06990 [Thermoanaerobaculia bacterium]
MRGLGRRLQERARRLWRWLFPERIELPEEVARLLRAMYPALDLGAVRFHQGLPHLTRLLGGEAITVPALLARRRTCIYIDPEHYDTGSVEGIGTLLHEAYHALQAQEAGWGLGPFRPFLMLYFAAGAANRFRYKGHPMEEAAYLLAGRRHSRFESAFPDWRGDLTVLEAPCRGLAAPASGLRFWRDLARSVPFARRLAAAEPIPLAVAALLLPLPVAAWLAVWSVAVAVAWLGWLLMAGLGAGVAAVMGFVGAAFSWIEDLSSPQDRNLS